MGGKDRNIQVVELGYYDDKVVKCLLILILFICFGTIVLCIFDSISRKMEKNSGCILSAIVSVVGVLFVTMGILGIFFLSRNIYPFAEISDGFFQPSQSNNQVTHFFGAKTHIGHVFFSVVYANAVVLSSFPTVLLILFIYTIIFNHSRINRKVSENNSLLELALITSIVVIPFFSLWGMFAVSRYYGFSIIMIGLYTISITSKTIQLTYADISKMIKGFFAGAILLFWVELGFNFPLYSCYRPFWIIRGQEYLNEVRTGKWEAAEAMTWGEELALSGAWIEDYCNQNGLSIMNTRIVCDYGREWYTNPGFELVPYSNWCEDGCKCDNNTFLVFAKFQRYRHTVPNFFRDVKALETIRINGEATAWIYNSTQLNDYYKYGYLSE